MTSNSRASAYEYPAQGMAAVRPHAATSIAGEAQAYDANGNLVSGNGRFFAWDGDNRIASMLSGGTKLHFVYGPDGRRPKKASESVCWATTLYLGADLEVPLAAGLTNGPPVATAWRKHIHADVRKVGSTPARRHRDPSASIRVTSDAAGVLAKRVAYQPHGELETTTDPAANETKGYIGETRDPETGLMYLNARYYDALRGRFVSPDWWDPNLPGVGTSSSVAAMRKRNMFPRLTRLVWATMRMVRSGQVYGQRGRRSSHFLKNLSKSRVLRRK